MINSINILNELIKVIEKNILSDEMVKYITSHLQIINHRLLHIIFDHEEYENYCSIERMICYIIHKPLKFVKYQPFALSLLVHFKSLLEKIGWEDYNFHYELFIQWLDGHSDYFNVIIFDTKPDEKKLRATNTIW